MKNIGFLCFGFLLACCQMPRQEDSRAEKEIIETLAKETQYFCERKLEKWAEQWSQKPFVSKMYTGNRPFKLFSGWAEIRQNTVDHIEAYPDPIPIPETNPDYTIELFQETAWVFYSKKGADGPVREARFMVREDEKWKIARMQTIY